MREVELKSVVPDPQRTIAALRAAGAVPVLEGRLCDTLYDTPDGALGARDVVLRLREFAGASGTRVTLEWKGPTTCAEGYKVRDELGTTIGDAVVLSRLLGELGYVVIRDVERHIVQFEFHGATVRVEQYPRMDALVEVEGEPAAIEAAIDGTGLPRNGFTSERLRDFVMRFESRTGQVAAICRRELLGEHHHAADV
jgi:adenylate cyclase class IV